MSASASEMHMDNALEQLLETWRTNNRISLFLIDHISDEGHSCCEAPILLVNGVQIWGIEQDYAARKLVSQAGEKPLTFLDHLIRGR